MFQAIFVLDGVRFQTGNYQIDDSLLPNLVHSLVQRSRNSDVDKAGTHANRPRTDNVLKQSPTPSLPNRSRNVKA